MMKITLLAKKRKRKPISSVQELVFSLIIMIMIAYSFFIRNLFNNNIGHYIFEDLIIIVLLLESAFPKVLYYCIEKRFISK